MSRLPGSDPGVSRSVARHAAYVLALWHRRHPPPGAHTTEHPVSPVENTAQSFLTSSVIRSYTHESTVTPSVVARPGPAHSRLCPDHELSCTLRSAAGFRTLPRQRRPRRPAAARRHRVRSTPPSMSSWCCREWARRHQVRSTHAVAPVVAAVSTPSGGLAVAAPGSPGRLSRRSPVPPCPGSLDGQPSGRPSRPTSTGSSGSGRGRRHRSSRVSRRPGRRRRRRRGRSPPASCGTRSRWGRRRGRRSGA